MGEAGPKARAGSLEGRARAQGILGLVSAHWWVELGPRVSGWRSLGVPGLVPAHWFVGKIPCPLVGRAMSRGSCGLRGS